MITKLKQLNTSLNQFEELLMLLAVVIGARLPLLTHSPDTRELMFIFDLSRLSSLDWGLARLSLLTWHLLGLSIWYWLCRHRFGRTSAFFVTFTLAYLVATPLLNQFTINTVSLLWPAWLLLSLLTHRVLGISSGGLVISAAWLWWLLPGSLPEKLIGIFISSLWISLSVIKTNRYAGQILVAAFWSLFVIILLSTQLSLLPVRDYYQPLVSNRFGL